MMNYFQNCKNENEVRITFRALSKQHHPDTGGDAEIFKEVSRQYNLIKDKGLKAQTQFNSPKAHQQQDSYFDGAESIWSELLTQAQKDETLRAVAGTFLQIFSRYFK